MNAPILLAKLINGYAKGITPVHVYLHPNGRVWAQGPGAGFFPPQFIGREFDTPAEVDAAVRESTYFTDVVGYPIHISGYDALRQHTLVYGLSGTNLAGEYTTYSLELRDIDKLRSIRMSTLRFYTREAALSWAAEQDKL